MTLADLIRERCPQVTNALEWEATTWEQARDNARGALRALEAVEVEVFYRNPLLLDQPDAQTTQTHELHHEESSLDGDQRVFVVRAEPGKGEVAR